MSAYNWSDNVYCAPMSISILSPSPCLPALLGDGISELDLIVTRADCSDDEVAAWGAVLQLRDVASGERVALGLRSATPLPLPQVPPHGKADAAEGRRLFAGSLGQRSARIGAVPHRWPVVTPDSARRADHSHPIFDAFHHLR